MDGPDEAAIGTNGEDCTGAEAGNAGEDPTRGRGPEGKNGPAGRFRTVLDGPDGKEGETILPADIFGLDATPGRETPGRRP